MKGCFARWLARRLRKSGVRCWGVGGRFMWLVDQDQANFASEVRVTTDHFLREVELVNDSLTGTVTAGKKLQIADVVEKAVSVDMVHGFFGKKFSSEVLFHYIPVFKNVAGRFSVFSGNNHSNVAVSCNSFSGLLVRIMRLVRQSPKLRATFCAAQPLYPVNGSAGATLDVHSIPALDASGVPGFFRQSPAQSPAFGRAVHWVFSEFLSVGPDRCRFVTEQFPANAAIEICA